MSLFVERKYIILLSHKLERFKHKGNNVFAFRCPLCGDSQKSKRKSRGNLFEYKGFYMFKCYNCNEAFPFVKLLKDKDRELYDQYMLEQFAGQEAIAPISDETFEAPPEPADLAVFDGLKTIDELPPEHFARSYIKKRLIPKSFWSTLYFCPQYVKFVNSLVPGKLPEKLPEHERVIIPFVDKDGNVLGFSGRALDPTNKNRYQITLLEKNSHPVYGIDRVDFSKKFYVVEGQFDSMFLDNCMAARGSSLASTIRHLEVPKENAVLIFDNEPRNAVLLATMDRAIKENFFVSIWPKSLQLKDINAMVIAGFPPSYIQKIIDENTYQGLAAQLAFGAWKEVELNESRINSDY